MSIIEILKIMEVQEEAVAGRMHPKTGKEKAQVGPQIS